MKKPQKAGKHFILPLLLLACLPGPSMYAQDAQDAAQTEQRLAHIRQELDAIARERRRLESERGTAARQLRRADEQVAAAARSLRQTEAQLAEQQAALDELATRRSAMHTRLDTLRAELASLLRAAYAEGEIAPLKQLLAQDQLSQLTRAMIWQRYLQRHRQQHMNALQEELAALDTLEGEMAERRHTLEAAHGEQQQRTRELEHHRQIRARTRTALDSRYADHTARERALGQDIRALEQLLSRLREAAANADTAGALALQPGQMAWPLSGSLLRRYNQPLADGRRSSGVLIDAPPGTAVHAVADGAVVFSEWMTGYGMLLIVDHGHGQMSLYAHNETLLKQTGDHVRRGDTIASVGHSGGQNTSGLYFELRHDGQPVNPERWLSPR